MDGRTERIGRENVLTVSFCNRYYYHILISARLRSTLRIRCVSPQL